MNPNTWSDRQQNGSRNKKAQVSWPASRDLEQTFPAQPSFRFQLPEPQPQPPSTFISVTEWSPRPPDGSPRKLFSSPSRKLPTASMTLSPTSPLVTTTPVSWASSKAWSTDRSPSIASNWSIGTAQHLTVPTPPVTDGLSSMQSQDYALWTGRTPSKTRLDMLESMSSLRASKTQMSDYARRAPPRRPTPALFVCTPHEERSVPSETLPSEDMEYVVLTSPTLKAKPKSIVKALEKRPPIEKITRFPSESATRSHTVKALRSIERPISISPMKSREHYVPSSATSYELVKTVELTRAQLVSSMSDKTHDIKPADKAHKASFDKTHKASSDRKKATLDRQKSAEQGVSLDKSQVPQRKPSNRHDSAPLRRTTSPKGGRDTHTVTDTSRKTFSPQTNARLTFSPKEPEAPAPRAEQRGGSLRMSNAPDVDKRPRRLSLIPLTHSSGTRTRRRSHFKKNEKDFYMPPLLVTKGSYIEPTALKLFVGTWNTECVPVTWESFLGRPLQYVPDEMRGSVAREKRQAYARGKIKTVAGVPIKSTMKAQVFPGPSFYQSEASDHLVKSETLCLTSSDEEETRTRSASSVSNHSRANSLDDSQMSHFSLDEPGAGAPRHVRRTSSVQYQKGERPGFERVLERHKSGENNINGSHALDDWIAPGYDIYLICVQECTAALHLFHIIAVHCSKINGDEYKNIDLDTYKISGYGDGATFFPKSTAIGCICRADYIDRAWSVLDSFSYSFNKLNASKGAVCLMAEALQQRLLFIGCHLTPAGPEARLQSRLEIRRRICEWLNIKSFDDYFDHVIWSGDFNFRLRDVTCRQAIRCLERHAIRTLFQFDEIYDSVWSEDLASDKFVEEEVTFFPTYKKIKGRTPCPRTAPGWVSEEYSVRYKVQWYKGGRTKDRVPAWTDRIIKWTSTIATKPMLFIQGTYRAADDLEEGNPLMHSDHSPVAVGLVLGCT
eukprot:Blabericola_migrator_1__556@NODE_1137_length_5314_cov_93_770536_g773_i0_p1_GENE_NODE_1137_length_5314_cov_93_770536_g773_i0NODE_1137_length_5314_cov_93_770536_g773_i0_p1_ORF_typecomplete_len954_score156_31Exo_endo_phos/PF03372_23/0_00058_NODE_1137_length_5314_cov_93_770536_g773_i016514512